MYITSSSILSVKEILVIGSLKMLMPEFVWLCDWTCLIVLG